MAWNDEFNADGLPNEKDWGFGCEGYIHSKESEQYQGLSVIVKDIVLAIEARKKSRKDPNSIAGNERRQTNRPNIEYTLFLISTRDKCKSLIWPIRNPRDSAGRRQFLASDLDSRVCR
ncbi:MAG: hypothetical protein AAF086_06920 [Planctomycetota bacterium]